MGPMQQTVTTPCTEAAACTVDTAASHKSQVLSKRVVRCQNEVHVYMHIAHNDSNPSILHACAHVNLHVHQP